MSNLQYTLVVKCCTDALGNPFFKIYYGIDDELIVGRALTLENPISDFAYTFTQLIKGELLSKKMYFKQLDTNLAVEGTNESPNSVFIGTDLLSVKEYEKIYIGLREIAIGLNIHFVHIQEENDIVLEEFGKVMGYVPLDPSKGLTTQEQYEKMTMDYIP